MNTKGHLLNNGGIRGHSAGDIFPYRIMLQGELHALKYWVINPQGHKLYPYATAQGAHALAEILKEYDDNECY